MLYSYRSSGKIVCSLLNLHLLIWFGWPSGLGTSHNIYYIGILWNARATRGCPRGMDVYALYCISVFSIHFGCVCVTRSSSSGLFPSLLLLFTFLCPALRRPRVVVAICGQTILLSFSVFLLWCMKKCSMVYILCTMVMSVFLSLL